MNDSAKGHAPILAAGGIVLRGNTRPRIAVVRLRREKAWVLPKGKLLPREHPRDAAKREVLEETGHDVSVQEFLGSMSYAVEGRIKIVQFWLMRAIGAPVGELMGDVKAVKWLPLKDAVATHSYANSRDQIHPDLATEVERRSLPPVRWRLNWRNPSNDRRALYVASHAYAIDGMDDRDARQLLAELLDGATRREYVYRHRWRPGDAVMWDNRAMLHRGRPWDYSQERSMVRTTISATDADGLAEVRPPSAIVH